MLDSHILQEVSLILVLSVEMLPVEVTVDFVWRWPITCTSEAHNLKDVGSVVWLGLGRGPQTLGQYLSDH